MLSFMTDCKPIKFFNYCREWKISLHIYIYPNKCNIWRASDNLSSIYLFNQYTKYTLVKFILDFDKFKAKVL